MKSCCFNVLWVLIGLACVGCDDDRERVRVYEDRPVRVYDSPNDAYVTGVITTREAVALPPQAVAVVRLVEEYPDGRRVIVRQNEIRSPRTFPVQYRLPYPPTGFHRDRHYYVEASIESPSGPFATVDRHPVVLTGQPVRGADVVVVRRSGPTVVTTGPSVRSTYRTLGGTVIYPDRRPLPADAVVRVNLIEVGRDGRRTVVDGTVVNRPRSSSIPFTIQRETRHFKPDCRYEVESIIESKSGRWRSRSPYVLATSNRADDRIELTVRVD